MNDAVKDPVAAFRGQRKENIARYSGDQAWKDLSSQWLKRAIEHQYMYNFDYLGRPVIQTPIDMVAIQEIIWNVKPDLIIETGIAHGGSLIMSASMLAMIDYCEAVEKGQTLDPKASKRRVLGIEIDIREHNRAAIETHPMSHMIDMIQGSSVDPQLLEQVYTIAKKHQRVMVFLDSNHTHEHVLAELEAYAPLTSKGSYCCVFDTIVEDMPKGFYSDRPWDVGDNPKTAVFEYLRRLSTEGRSAADGTPLKLEIDKVVEDKLMITVTPDGYLIRPE